MKTDIGSLIATISLSDYYNKAEIDDIDNELSALVLNTYNKSGTYTFRTDYYNIEHINTQFDLKANCVNTYTKSEVDIIITRLGIPSMLTIINSNGVNITNILSIRYTQSEVDTLISTFHNKAETGNMLNQKVNTPGNSFIQGILDAYVFRCGKTKTKHDDGLNSLTLTLQAASESTIDLRAEESFANMLLQTQGTSYIGLPTIKQYYYV